MRSRRGGARLRKAGVGSKSSAATAATTTSTARFCTFIPVDDSKPSVVKYESSNRLMLVKGQGKSIKRLHVLVLFTFERNFPASHGHWPKQWPAAQPQRTALHRAARGANSLGCVGL